MSYACCRMCRGAGVIVYPKQKSKLGFIEFTCELCKGTGIDAERTKWLKSHPYG